MRMCKGCNTEKELSEYYLKKDQKSVKSSFCKVCYNSKYKSDKDIKKIYYEKNKEKINHKNKEWVENNKDIREVYLKSWREENKEKIKEKREKYVAENTDVISKGKKNWYENNKEEIKEKERIRYRKCRESNIVEERSKKNKYVNEKLKDPIFNLKFKIRSLIRNAFKRKFTSKSKKTTEILGCSFEELKIHLESKFDENMNWENYGTYWHIDHIKPISLAQNEKEVEELNHYTNLQPLFWIENIRKSDFYQSQSSSSSQSSVSSSSDG